MTAPWTLAPCLVSLRDEFNDLAPSRDRASDGSIGDAAHSARASDHNPDENRVVHAIDVDKDLRRPGVDMERVVQFLLARCRSGAEKRLKYIIFRQRIWAKSNGWRQQAYTGPNAHKEHAHLSAEYDTKSANSRASWHLAELTEDEVDDADIDKIVDRTADLVVARLLAHKIDDPYIVDDPKHPEADDKSLGAYWSYSASKGTVRELGPKLEALGAELKAIREQLAAGLGTTKI